jgi:hypothetical protein
MLDGLLAVRGLVVSAVKFSHVHRRSRPKHPAGSGACQGACGPKSHQLESGCRNVRTYVRMRYLYMTIERDPEHAWLVIKSERREIELDDSVNFHDWARTQRMPPNVELKFLCSVSAR